ncbi:NAD-dependent epimerase/dehydratase family protein [Picrophilus oshimae]|uniref:Nucleoside-diphosphate-sugar epimerase n=1 Tax=Picrophilus torridus (strain ATCC 700027 / DSM 9790 / JCM 10055 / NBRC 100828 / KAW 2/3) TaxID=1122961 RepID=A0A8G2FWJ5_PICTO|nr:SDR family oxidoreductase [Picrophilus oshimae]SMD30776.1 Nucleoside-diphosphate-sugar epimerase [Picrophilus oshimae DSM 9789]
MNILVTGGTGYIGRILVPELIGRGHNVTVIDRGFLDYDDPTKDYEGAHLIRDDIRTCDPSRLRGFDGVIDLAALSNDPSGDLDKTATWDINYIGRVRIARLAKKLGAKRYVVASSCSVYGFRDGLSDESTPTNPLTTYAEANVAVERDNLSLNDSSFRATALRFATVFGYSKRFRLDLVVNAMTFYGYKNRVVRMMRDGNQYRPFIHVKDVSRALIQAIESNDDIGGRPINVGNERLNMQIKDIATIIMHKLGKDTKLELYGDPDNRSYQVKFDAARDLLKFETKFDLEYGVDEIIDKCKEGLDDLPQMHTVNYYKTLLNAEDSIAKYLNLKPKIIF